MIGFVLRYWRYIALILALLTALGALWYYGHTKYRQGWDECALKQEKAEIEGVKTNVEIKNKNNRVAISDIDKRLIADWLYGE